MFYALPVLIAYSEIMLRRSIVLFCGFQVPFNGFGIALLYSLSLFITKTETVLPSGISLLGGLTPPLNSFGILTIFVTRLALLGIFV